MILLMYRFCMTQYRLYHHSSWGFCIYKVMHNLCHQQYVRMTHGGLGYDKDGILKKRGGLVQAFWVVPLGPLRGYVGRVALLLYIYIYMYIYAHHVGDLNFGPTLGSNPEFLDDRGT